MNILMFVCDTLRADHLGCYDYFRDASPNIDRLAKEGILFEECFASGINTGVSFTTIHTGLYPIHHKVYNFCPATLVLDDIPTLAEILRTNGYTTAAFDNLAYNRAWCRDPVHFYRGFEHYITDISNPKDWNAKGESVMAEWYTERLIHWIKTHNERKFFAFVHPWDVHQPYTQPQPYREVFHHKKGDLSDLEVREAPAGYKYVPGWGKVGEIFEGRGTIPEMRSPGSVPRREASIDLYDGAIAYLDKCIGEVLAFLENEKMLEDTLILVTSDHGELLGQHEIYSHINVYDGNIHVPLIIRHPATLPQGRRIKGLAGTVDFVPTILDLSDIQVIPPVDGVSLTPLIEGQMLREKIFSEDGGGVRCIITDEWKLIYDYADEKVELYNIINDPMEIMDLSDEMGGQVKALKEKLDQWVKESLEGQEDPILDVVRNHDSRKTYERINIKNYIQTDE